MNQSRNSGKVAEALSMVQGQMGVFEVNRKGYNYSYLDLAGILSVALPIMGKYGLSIMQFPSVEVIDSQPWVVVLTRLNVQDEWIESTLSFPMIEPSKKTDSDIMMCASTVTYLRRISIQGILGIAGSDKDVEQMQEEEINKNTGEQK